MLNFVRNGQVWTNITDEHEQNGGVDPTEFRHTCGLSDKHFELSYEERAWYFSPKATKMWRETNAVDKDRMERRIFGLLWGKATRK